MSVFAQTERLSLVPGGPVRTPELIFWHNSVAELHVACFNLQQTALLVTADFAGVTSFGFELYTDATALGELLMTKTLDAAEVNEITLEEWQAGTASQIAFSFFASDLNQTFVGEVGEFHYVLFATLATGITVLASGKCLLRRNMAGYDTVDPVATEVEVDAEGNPIVDAEGNPIEIVPV
jgi:hypothetical protein